MDAVREHFREREEDLRVSIELVRQASVSNAYKARPMRAACYLLMYNLVEATGRNVVQAVFDAVGDEDVSFDELRLELKVLIWKHAHDQNAETFVTNVSSLSNDIANLAFSPSKLFSGNVDARKLRDMANSVGYSDEFGDGRIRKEKRASERLLTIKTRRNTLAHGHQSFGELGRDITMEDIEKDGDAAIWFLNELVDNVAVFIASKQYLACVATGASAS